MELQRHKCRQMIEKDRAFRQMTLDDDFIVRDHKPDVVRILYTKGDIYIESTKIGNQVVWVSGRLHFTMLYQSDQEERSLESLEGDMPFQEKINLDHAREGDCIQVDSSIEDLTAGLINSRKIVIRGVISLSVVDEEEVEYQLAEGILQAKEARTRTKQAELLTLTEYQSVPLSVTKEIPIPSTKGTIGDIILFQWDLGNREFVSRDKELILSAQMPLWVLYRREDGSGYEYYETVLTMTESLGTWEEGAWPQIRIIPERVDLKVLPDYDGENRMFGLDLHLAVEKKGYREEEISLLDDAYAWEKELYLEREELSGQTLKIRNLSTVRIKEQEKLPAKKERILQIGGSFGRVLIDRVIKKDNGIEIEGILMVSVLYHTNEDAMPYAGHSSQHGFWQFVEIGDVNSDTILKVTARLEQLQVNLLDHGEYEVKAEIEVETWAIQPIKIFNITGIREEEMDKDAFHKQPGLIGVRKGDGEDLWDIAKRYHASTENIIDLGEKVLVVKQVGK